ncbi:hypothetical protein [Salinarimonas ramus]|uniref:Uncharacterized protein n=1 Tax=Salinarimonas ramus TaxID=690164 RepID=A0A917Q7T0_9HYPH|nr:hypothetical protein [Salinarimonas ramus]GGK34031.1 hypothetical protein GCM10011322_20880 [Salinarimonas ramus]
MISLIDAIGLSDLTEEEIAALAEHEHVPEIVAATLGAYLLHEAHGAERIRDMMLDDLRAAIRRRDLDHARRLNGALRHFLSEHPEAALHPPYAGRGA